MRKAIWLILMSILVFTPSLFAEGSSESSDQEDYKVLHVYTALDTEVAQYFIENFEMSSGMEVEFVRMSAGEVLARVEAEAENPQASVWFGGSNPSHISAAGKGLLEPYRPNIPYDVSEEFHAEDYSWNGFYTAAIGFVSNTEFLQENGIEAPASWDDLLDPVYASQVEMAYPYTSGTAYTTWATRIQMLGLEAALDWWEEFDVSIHQYTRSGSACVARVGLGETGVGIAFTHDILGKGIDKGYPVVLSFPSEGTGYEVGGISLIKGAKEPEEARIFIDWAYSDEAQSLFQDVFYLPVNPNAPIAEGGIPLSEINLIEYDAITVGENKEAYVTAWRDRIGQ